MLASINQTEGRTFFLDAPEGTGKTFFINLLLAKIRSEKDINLAVACSGIAATLLKRGRTAHLTLKLPFNMINAEILIYNITKHSDLSNLLKRIKIII